LALQQERTKAPTSMNVLDRLIATMGRKRVNQGFHYLPKFRLLYCQIPKAATATIRSFLYRKMLEGTAPPQHIESLRNAPYRHGLSYSFCQLHHFTDAQFNDILTSQNILKFTVVRDPYTRALSAFRHKIVRKDLISTIQAELKSLYNKDQDSEVTFDEFVGCLAQIRNTVNRFNPHFAPQWNLMGAGIVPFDKIAKLENLDVDLSALFASVGLAWDRSKVAKHGTQSTDPNDMSEAAKRQLQEIYREDFDNLGYALS
jgi:hypothetical protein